MYYYIHFCRTSILKTIDNREVTIKMSERMYFKDLLEVDSFLLDFNFLAQKEIA